MSLTGNHSGCLRMGETWPYFPVLLMMRPQNSAQFESYSGYPQWCCSKHYNNRITYTKSTKNENVVKYCHSVWYNYLLNLKLNNHYRLNYRVTLVAWSSIDSTSAGCASISFVTWLSHWPCWAGPSSRAWGARGSLFSLAPRSPVSPSISGLTG